MTKPKITVYCISHEYGKFLEEAVESVLRQTTDNWELLLIDNASVDIDKAAIALKCEMSQSEIRSMKLTLSEIHRHQEVYKVPNEQLAHSKSFAEEV